MNIKFVPGSKKIFDLVKEPEASKNLIPEWYKNINGNIELQNVKKCMPFLDSLSHGYMQTTWANIYINKVNDKVTFSHDGDVPLFFQRESTDMPIGDNFYNIEFVWQRPWSTVLPDEFSALITHPLNRIDLPFITLSGIVDFDKSIHAPVGNMPFFIKKDFIGLIPKGTPMFQIIPIKRESWQKEKIDFDQNFWSSKLKERQNIKDFYKKNIWTKKIFK